MFYLALEDEDEDEDEEELEKVLESITPPQKKIKPSKPPGWKPGDE